MKTSANRIREDAALLNNKASYAYDLIARISRDCFPVTDKNDAGKKRAERVSWKSPVNLGFARGITRDISASGVFFETDADATCPLLSSWMRFEVELDTPDCKILLKYLGEVVRVEPRNKKMGVAVRIIESSAEPVWLT